MKKNIFFITFLFVIIIVANCSAQLNTVTRQLRFTQSVQKAADTAATSANKGRIWYDFSTSKFRKNENGTNSFLSSGGSVGAFWPLSGTAFLSGDVAIVGSSLLTLSGNIYLENSQVTTNITDFSQTLQAGQSTIELNTNDIINLTSQNTTISNRSGFSGLYADQEGLGFVAGSTNITMWELSGLIKIDGLPTSNPCALPEAGSGTLWNNSGILNICP